MSPTVNPESAKATAWLQAAKGAMTPPAVGDVENRRKGMNGLFSSVLPTNFPSAGDVERHDTTVKAADGFDIPIHIYRKKNTESSSPGPAVFHTHGGGFIAITAELTRPWIERYVSLSGVPFYVVEYRYAPEHPFSTPIDDCYKALQWLWENAEREHIDPARVAFYGDSAGGNLAAALAIRARDQKLDPQPKLQMIISGMLDDRTTKVHPEDLGPACNWTHEDNLTGWGAYLGEKNVATPDISPLAAPARVTSMEGLPAAYIETYQLDLFRRENATYASRLADAGVDVEFHLYPGLPHAFDILAPNITLAVAASKRRIQVFKDL